jgi:hypothetical protein
MARGLRSIELVIDGTWQIFLPKHRSPYTFLSSVLLSKKVVVLAAKL